MAEIKIEKDNNKNWLPIILGIVGLLLIAWLLVDVFDKDGEPELLSADEVDFPDLHVKDEKGIALDEVNAQEEDDVVVAAVVAESHAHDMDENYPHELNEEFDDQWDGSKADYKSNVTYYLSAIDRISEDMNVHHDYSSTALKALANSISVLANTHNMSEAVNVKEKCNAIQQKANAITKDWRATDHANKIKMAALQAVSVVKEVQQKKFPELANEVTEMEKAANQIDPGTLTLNQKKTVKQFFKETADVLQKMK